MRCPVLIIFVFVFANIVIAKCEVRNLSFSLLFEKKNKLNSLMRSMKIFDAHKSVLNTIELIHEHVENELYGDLERIHACSPLLSSYINCYLAMEIYNDTKKQYGKGSPTTYQAYNTFKKKYKTLFAAMNSGNHRCSLRKGTFSAIYYDYLGVLKNYERFKT